MSSRLGTFLGLVFSLEFASSCNTYTHDLLSSTDEGSGGRTDARSSSGAQNTAGGASVRVSDRGGANAGIASSTSAFEFGQGGAFGGQGSSSSVVSSSVGSTGGATHEGGASWGGAGASTQSSTGGASGTSMLSGGAAGFVGTGGAIALGGGNSAGGTRATTVEGEAGKGGGGTSEGGNASVGGTSHGGVSAIGGATSTDPCAAIQDTLVDDGEDGDGNIFPCYGRQGFWYSYAQYKDAQSAASLFPPAGELFTMSQAELTNRAAKLSASSNTNLGDCGFGLLFNSQFSGQKSTIALAPNQYIKFRYRTSGIPNGKLRFQLLLKSTAATADGGACSGNGCNDHYSCPLDASDGWTVVNVRLAQSTSGCHMGLTQSGTGASVAFDLSKVLGAQLNVAAGVSGAFEVWLDDVQVNVSTP